MVYFYQPNCDPTIVPFSAGLLEDQGQSLVFASDCVSLEHFYIRTPRGEPRPKTHVSIVICTYGRPDSLNDTLKSLTRQTYKNFEVILITEKGNLSELRDKGLRSARGSVVSFIDDDVYCPSTWLEGVTQNFREGVVGVTGPTVITREYRANRDSIAFQGIAWPLLRFFGVSDKPGHLSPTGAPSMASNFEECQYEGPVEYLECCNMSVRRREALDAGGFDKIFVGTGEWAEPDLSLKLKKSGLLWFSPIARLYHRPSQQGIYKARLATAHRWKNFMEFQHRWIKSGLRTYLYRGFVWLYFTLKTNRMI